jgi:anti-anti-sigma factor
MEQTFGDRESGRRPFNLGTTPFRVELDDDPAGLLVRFFGDLNIDSEEALAAAFRALNFSGRPRLTVDFESVPYVNSAGIAALLGVLMQARDKASLIAFRGLSRHLEKIFRMTGFSALVQFEPAVQKP